MSPLMLPARSRYHVSLGRPGLGEEPGLHRTDRGAIDMDVDCELSHL